MGHDAARLAGGTPAPVRLEGEGLVLREWTEADLDCMVSIFDDPTVAHRTPLPSPFTRTDAEMRLARGRQGDWLILAVTVDGREPLGEVLITASAHLGYSVGQQYRGQGLASRALRVLVGYAFGVLGMQVVLLEIEPDNEASVAVARRAGFVISSTPALSVEDKARTYTLRTWERRRGATTADLEQPKLPAGGGERPAAR